MAGSRIDGHRAKRDDAELRRKLAEQLDFLRRSVDLFDAGHESEAIRLAVPIRVLVHDTGKSTSLLQLLGVKDTQRFHDTAGAINPANLAPTWGLFAMQIAVDPS